jgi:hypothetical protein
MDVYEMLIRDLKNNVDIDEMLARQVVELLDGEGLLDYDTLKEYYVVD